MTKYFIALYEPSKPFCYDLRSNSFLPYYPARNRTVYNYETARAVLKRARRLNPDKRDNITLDCMTV